MRTSPFTFFLLTLGMSCLPTGDTDVLDGLDIDTSDTDDTGDTGLSTTPFVGTWGMNENCEGQMASYDVTVSAVDADTTLQIYNIWDWELTTNATLTSASAADIAVDTGYIVWFENGTATLNSGELILDFDATTTGDAEECVAVGTLN